MKVKVKHKQIMELTVLFWKINSSFNHSIYNVLLKFMINFKHLEKLYICYLKGSFSPSLKQEECLKNVCLNDI